MRPLLRSAALFVCAVSAGVGAFWPASAQEAVQKGMPQLDFANPLTVSQVVWLALIFGFLYVALSRWALPQVAQVLELRAASINSDLEAARAAKAQSDTAVAELGAATRNAQAAAQAEITGAVDQARRAASAQAAELNARLEAQLKSAEARIEAARTAALGALREVATETTQMVVDRLTGTSFPSAQVASAVDQAMSARQKA